MSLRQAAFALLRRLRPPPQTLTATFCGRTTNALIQTGKMELSYQYDLGHTWKRQHREFYLWIFLSGQAVILSINSSIVMAEDVPTELSSENNIQGANLTGLRKIEDGSVISNIHTSKWRVFTDNGRDLFLQGKLEEAEKLFLSALQEAKEGFGGRDPHVAAAYNNLAELYRVKKAFCKAEPLYLEAVKILEESFGPEDIRVGAALHNLGQFYLVQRKLEEARMCYERALKIKRRVLGHGHRDYADTMYHLGTVLYLQGKEKDSETLIQDSIKILEDGGLGESIICLRRLRYLAQVAANMLYIARVEMLNSNRLRKINTSEAIAELDKAKDHLGQSIRIAQRVLDKSEKQEDKQQYYGASRETRKDENAALMILLQSLNALGLLGITKQELLESRGEHSPTVEAECALHQCISAFKEFGIGRSMHSSPDLKVEYLSCLKQLASLIRDSTTESTQQSRRATLQELKDEIKHVEAELSLRGKRKN